jgi:hypothetical protein
MLTAPSDLDVLEYWYDSAAATASQNLPIYIFDSGIDAAHQVRQHTQVAYPHC